MASIYVHHTSRLRGNIISSYHFPWLAVLSISGLFFLLVVASLPAKEAMQVFN